MIQAYLVPIEEAAFVFFGLAVLLLIPICAVHYRRFGYVMPSRATVFYSLLFYSLCAVFLVSLPLPTITADFCEVHTLARQVRLTPFQFVPDIILGNQITLRHFNLISMLVSSVFLQAFFNFLLLMPLGFYLRYYFNLGWGGAAAIALAVTGLFELSQITGLFGFYPCPYRTFDVDDLILNTAGALVGYGTMPFFSAHLPNLQARHAPPVAVSCGRRWVAFAVDWFLANSVSRLLGALLLGLHTPHALWLDGLVYGLWFVGVPSLWQGRTVGKALVNIQLVQSSGQPVQLSQLALRYGLLLGLPVLTEVALLHQLSEQQRGWITISLLILLVLEAIALAGLMLVRPDHRGLHDLMADTHHHVLASRQQNTVSL
ncbi:MAG: VanZ family protein [Leptolyngbyaceae cyanobacterium]